MRREVPIQGASGMFVRYVLLPSPRTRWFSGEVQHIASLGGAVTNWREHEYMADDRSGDLQGGFRCSDECG